MIRKRFAAMLLLGMGLPVARAQTPEDFDHVAGQLTRNATREGSLHIATTTDLTEAVDLIAGFQALYPGIKVDYRQMSSGDVYDRVLASTMVDVAWSSAVDLQVKLVNDGHAQTYVSPEAAGLPPWAVWRNEAYATTAEPVVIVYNKALPEGDIPASHADLTRLLLAQPDALKGKVATYDPERSGAGFLFITQDVEITRRTWDLVRAMGQAGVKLYAMSDTMLDRVAAGEQLIAYNVIGSYALARRSRDPSLGVVLPSDYTIILSRIALIPKAAPHPNAARVFLDYLLSRQGQGRLAARSIHPVREDVPATTTAMPETLRPVLRPIRVGPGVLTYLDQVKRSQFLQEWRRALQGR